VPLTKLQSCLLRLLANRRSPESYVAGAIALNRDGPRFSADIDIFHDGDDRLVAIAESDAEVMTASGFDVAWSTHRGGGKRMALVSGMGEQTQLEWAADSDFRFFPAQPDELFGYVLHPADLATNKAAAAANRRVPRDIIDLVTIHNNILPLGAVVTAAVGRFPGMTPEEMLAEIRRHSTFTAVNSRRSPRKSRSMSRKHISRSRLCSPMPKPLSRGCRATPWDACSCRTGSLSNRIWPFLIVTAAMSVRAEATGRLPRRSALPCWRPIGRCHRRSDGLGRQG
jgi:hypothetical protein